MVRLKTVDTDLARKELGVSPARYIDANGVDRLGEAAHEFSTKTRKVLEEEGILKKGTLMATKTDASFIPDDYFKKGRTGETPKICNLLKKETGIDFENEDTTEILGELSVALRNAKIYLKEYLKVKLPREIEDLTEFRGVNRLLAFLRKAHGLKKESDLGFSPYYCALIQVMRAEREYQESDFSTLDEDLDYVENTIFSPPEKNEERHFIRKSREKDKPWKEIIILQDSKKIEPIDANFSSRGKSHDRIITKMLSKVKYNPQEAINDGLGLKLEIPDDTEIEELFLFLAKYFSYKLGARHLECKNNKFLADDEETKILFRDLLEDQNVFLREQDNKVSNEDFKSISLKGYLTIEENKKQPFELQVVQLGNKNQERMSRHEIYERLQKINVMVRLFGSVSERYLNLLAEEAAQETGFLKAHIKKYFMERSLVRMHSPDRNRKSKIFGTQHSLDLKSIGLFPEDITIEE